MSIDLFIAAMGIAIGVIAGLHSAVIGSKVKALEAKAEAEVKAKL
jgi:hypothetical protein